MTSLYAYLERLLRVDYEELNAVTILSLVSDGILYMHRFSTLVGDEKRKILISNILQLIDNHATGEFKPILYNLIENHGHMIINQLVRMAKNTEFAKRCAASKCCLIC